MPVTVKGPWTKAARAMMKKKKKAKVRVTASVSGGTATQQTVTLTVPSTKADVGVVEIGSVANFAEAQGPSTIERFARQRQIVVSANLEGKPLGEGVDELAAFVKTLDLPSQKPGVTVIGFSIPYVPNPKPFDELSPPSLIWRTGRISGTQTYSNAVDNLPVLSMQLDAPDGFDGSPVFHTSGKVLGHLLRFGSDRYVVPTDRFAELLGSATTSPP